MDSKNCKVSDCKVNIPLGHTDRYSMPLPLCPEHYGTHCFSCGDAKNNNILWKTICIKCYKEYKARDNYQPEKINKFF